MFGSHLSTAGGLHNAPQRARELGMDCVQVFTKNQRQWAAPPLTADATDQFITACRDTEMRAVVSHGSYLINIGCDEQPTRDRSIALLRDELERCEALQIPLLVMHPGAHKGLGEQAGLALIIRALDRVHRDLPGYRTVTCLETTAGQGSTLGHRFEHLRDIIAGVREPDRLAVCLDTAHLFAAGYALNTAAGALSVMDEFDDVIGLDRLRAAHVNDSKTARGSRVDRHEHIGHGKIAKTALAALLRRPAMQPIPKVLETPKQDTPQGEPWDAVNLAELHRLARQKARARAKKTLTRPRQGR